MTSSRISMHFSCRPLRAGSLATSIRPRMSGCRGPRRTSSRGGTVVSRSRSVLGGTDAFMLDAGHGPDHFLRFRTDERPPPVAPCRRGPPPPRNCRCRPPSGKPLEDRGVEAGLVCRKSSFIRAACPLTSYGLGAEGARRWPKRAISPKLGIVERILSASSRPLIASSVSGGRPAHSQAPVGFRLFGQGCI